jgi:hypothetical protein
MDKTIRRVTSLKEQRAENFRYWQSISPGDRLLAVAEVTADCYSLKGVPREDVQRVHRTLVRVQRPSR